MTHAQAVARQIIEIAKTDLLRALCDARDGLERSTKERAAAREAEVLAAEATHLFQELYDQLTERWREEVTTMAKKKKGKGCK